MSLEFCTGPAHVISALELSPVVPRPSPGLIHRTPTVSAGLLPGRSAWGSGPARRHSSPLGTGLTQQLVSVIPSSSLLHVLMAFSPVPPSNCLLKLPPHTISRHTTEERRSGPPRSLLTGCPGPKHRPRGLARPAPGLPQLGPPQPVASPAPASSDGEASAPGTRCNLP